MTIKVAICDDNADDIDVLIEHMRSFSSSHNIFFTISKYPSGQALISAHEHNHYDIVFLDIEMPDMSGISVASRLRCSGDDDVILIFVTSYPEYMQDSFEVQPFQFLSKPLSSSSVEHVLSLVIDRYRHSHTLRMIADNMGQNRLIKIRDIIYIQNIKGEKRLLCYKLVNSEFTGHGTIQDWESGLTTNGFFSPCRGFLVNIGHVVTFDRNRVVMDNGEELPVSRRKYNQMQEMFVNRIVSFLD